MNFLFRSFSSFSTLLVLVALVALALVRLRPAEPETLIRRQFLMGTFVEVSAWGGERHTLEDGINRAFAEMVRLEALLGPGQGSDATRLSLSAGGSEVAPETAELVALGLEIQELSSGAFDLALGRLKALWGVEAETPRVPAEAEILQALTGTGVGGVRLKGGSVLKAHPSAMIDFGGVAKGYAVDRALEILRQAGAAGAAVNAGGDIRLLGDLHGRPWRIGIQHPRQSDHVLGTLELADVAVVTSGDYERYFEKEGERYHHLFDPRTGRPARGCRSVTVVAESAARADALATAAFVLGPQAGLHLLEELSEVEGILIDAAGQPHLTSGLQGKVKWR